jgi:hypothetical protein
VNKRESAATEAIDRSMALISYVLVLVG